MEFYTKTALGNLRSASFNSQRDGILRWIALWTIWRARCFNSQRDGILPFIKAIIPPYLCFNSQRDGILRAKWNEAQSHGLSFNSQRDGILPKGSSGNITIGDKFQFPTGWNSTRPCEKRPPRWQAVSIPNGMEFYRFNRKFNPRYRAFQFPTGWNSTPYSNLTAWLVMKFQFPTGWNSTTSG